MRLKKTLLVVDDEELVCRGILRSFKGCFDEVYFATHPEDAERILQRGDITSLVCDYHLGADLPPGNELLERWRRAYPQIRKAVLYSGADLSAVSSKWIDSKISKSLPMDSLLQAITTDDLQDGPTV